MRRDGCCRPSARAAARLELAAARPGPHCCGAAHPAPPPARRGGSQSSPRRSPTAACGARSLFLRGRGWRSTAPSQRAVARLPELDVRRMHALADRVSGTATTKPMAAFLDLLAAGSIAASSGQPRARSDHTCACRSPRPPLARWAEVWEKVDRASADADELQSRPQADSSCRS